MSLKVTVVTLLFRQSHPHRFSGHTQCVQCCSESTAGRLSGHHRLWATETLEAMLSFALLTNRRGLKVDVGVTDHLNDSVTTVT